MGYNFLQDMKSVDIGAVRDRQMNQDLLNLNQNKQALVQRTADTKAKKEMDLLSIGKRVNAGEEGAYEELSALDPTHANNLLKAKNAPNVQQQSMNTAQQAYDKNETVIAAREAIGILNAKTPEEQQALYEQSNADLTPEEMATVPQSVTEAMTTLNSLVDHAGLRSELYAVGDEARKAQKAERDAQKADRGGEAPTGYKWSDDNSVLLPITGGPADPNTITSSQRTSAQQIKVAAKGVDKALNGYLDIVKKYGAEVAPGIGKDSILAARRDVQMQMKELFNLGVLNGPDLDLMNEMLVDPTSIVGGTIANLPFTATMAERAEANVKQLKKQFTALVQAREDVNKGIGNILELKANDTRGYKNLSNGDKYTVDGVTFIKGQ